MNFLRKLNNFYKVKNYMIGNTTAKNTKELIDFKVLTYKDIQILTDFLSDQGKILPRRVTGLSSKEQKKIAKLIKMARIAALLPFSIPKEGKRRRRPWKKGETKAKIQ
jgi:small subunit ribosomal protein S18